MNKQRLSIAMCTYNGAQYLQEQLDSFTTQTRMPDELVVCDDCSTDDTVKLIQGFAKEAPFSVRLIVNENNLGSEKNFEKAIGLCEGDIIFLADQDDIWLPEKMFRFEEILSMSKDLAGVLTDATIVSESLEPMGFSSWQATKFNRSHQEHAMKGKQRTLLKYNTSMAGATFAFHAKLRDLVLPVPDSWSHDGWIILIIALMATLKIIPEPLNLWRQHEQQQLGSWKKKSFLEQLHSARWKNLSSDARVANGQYESAKKRIAALKLASPGKNEELSQLSRRLGERALHFNNRSRMSKSRMRRFSSIVNELLSLRYFRYSSGLRSAARDLLL